MNKITVLSRLKYPLLLVAIAIMWSTSGLCVKQIDWNPLAIAGVRSGIAAVVIFAGKWALVGGVIILVAIAARYILPEILRRSGTTRKVIGGLDDVFINSQFVQIARGFIEAVILNKK